jgi:hypothetical protein
LQKSGKKNFVKGVFFAKKLYFYKKAMKNFGLAVLFFVISLTYAEAQTDRQYTWKKYFTKFKIPVDFVIEEENDSSFSAHSSDKSLQLVIFPRKNYIDFKEKMARSSVSEDMLAGASLTEDIIKAGNHTATQTKEQEIYFEDLKTSLLEWMHNSKVQPEGEINFLPDLNGYWGIISASKPGNFHTSWLIVRDPDYPELMLFIWLYYADYEVVKAKKLLRSFMPY